MSDSAAGQHVWPEDSDQGDRSGDVTREAVLARAFVRLADTLASDFDIVDFLHGLSADSVEILRAEAAGVMLADPRGGPWWGSNALQHGLTVTSGPMNEPYLEVTYRKGRALAAYFYLPRSGKKKAVRTRRVDPGLIIDFASNGEALGIEITAPAPSSAVGELTSCPTSRLTNDGCDGSGIWFRPICPSRL